MSPLALWDSAMVWSQRACVLLDAAAFLIRLRLRAAIEDKSGRPTGPCGAMALGPRLRVGGPRLRGGGPRQLIRVVGIMLAARRSSAGGPQRLRRRVR